MDKGICKLSSVPVRSEPSGKAEMVNMLLFGETYAIAEQTNDWLRIADDHDGYQGWINIKQHTGLSIAPQTQTVSRTFPLLIAFAGNEMHHILPGSLLPDASEGGFSINGQRYQSPVNLAGSLQNIPATAALFLNVPYLWGGRSFFGIDCSGLTQIVFRLCGRNLLRDAKQQATQGEEIAFRDAVLPGDLAFFDNDDGVITHVGIMLSPDRIIHASGFVRIDPIDQYGILPAQQSQYSHKLRIIKRIF